MLVEKQYEKGLDIADPISASRNLKDTCLNMLKDQLEGRCYQSALIKDIKKIDRISECNISNVDLTAHGRVSVIFTAMVVTYPKNSIIVDCKVMKKINDQYFIAEKDDITIFVSNTAKFNILNIGQSIIIRLMQATYNTNKEKISGTGIPFIPNQKPKIYKCMGTVDKSMFTQISDLIHEEERLLNKNSKEAKFFNDMFYPFKEDKKDPKGVKRVNVKDLEDKSGIIGLSPEIRMELGMTYEWPDKTESIEEDINRVIMIMMHAYYSHIKLVNECIKHYSGSKDETLWKIYKSLKV